MSDQPPEGGGGGFFRGMFQRNTTVNAMAGSQIKIAGLEEATSQMRDLNSELKGLVTSLTGLTQQQAQLTSGISQTMKTIASTASQTSSAVEGVTSSIGRFRSGAMSIASIFGNAVNSNFVKDLAMFPLRYITGATDQARNVSMGVSTALGSQMYATGAPQERMMNFMSNFPGGVRGGVEDIIGLMGLQRQYGAMLDPNASNQFNPRAVGMLRGIAEMQAMTPGAPVAQLAQTIGGYASNTQAQQQAAYLTGGAFSIIGAGGRQKSISEWAEGILRWLEGQRPGDQRNKGFNYGELLAQSFPGSNIDAWLSQQGVPEGMKEYFWNYALAKSRMTGLTTTNILTGTGSPGTAPAPFRVTPANMGAGQGGNQAWSRLNAATAQSRGQFRLGGALTGMFSNKETANQWFNEIISQVMSDVIPAQIAGGSLQAMGVLPDPIQELLMTFLERSGTVGAALGGYIGYGVQGLTSLNRQVFQGLFAGGLSPNALGSQGGALLNAFGGNPTLTGTSDIQGILDNLGLSDLLDFADVGDVGWSSQGTRSTSGLHPSVKSGIDRMMRDNPKIRVNSGLRDTVQQRRLRAAGHSGVSGKPSAHTRGLAADLGPRSQYGWIVANASRYGLSSGAKHGEPWHVGLGDIGDDPAGLGGLFELFKEGVTKEGTISTIGSLIPTLLNLFLGSFGAGAAGADLSTIAYDPGLYAALRKAAVTKTGGLYGQEALAPSTGGGGGDGGGGGSTSVPGNASMVDALLRGGGPAGWTRQELSTLSSGAQVALLARKAGFPTDALVGAVRISERESGWDPKAHRSTADKSKLLGDRGLFQINSGPNHSYDDNRISQGWFNSYSEIFDPLINTQVAYRLFSGQGNKWGPAWGMTASGWSATGDPFYGTISAAEANKYVKEAGFGDYDPGDYPSPMMPMTNGGRTILFNNHFNIQSGGQGGGIDVRRTVTLLADQLEATMRQRLSRTN